MLGNASPLLGAAGEGGAPLGAAPPIPASDDCRLMKGRPVDLDAGAAGLGLAPPVPYSRTVRYSVGKGREPTFYTVLTHYTQLTFPVGLLTASSQTCVAERPPRAGVGPAP